MAADERPRRAMDGGDEISPTDERGEISARLLSRIRAALSIRAADVLSRLLCDLHGSELGQLLQRLRPNERATLVELAGPALDFGALRHVDETVRLEIVDRLSSERIADALRMLESNHAVLILKDLGELVRAEVLDHLPVRDRIRLRRSLDYPGRSVGRLMRAEYAAVPPFWTIGETIDHLLKDEELPERFSQIYIVDPMSRPIGSVTLVDLLRTGGTVPVRTIMNAVRHVIPDTMDREDAAGIFERYELSAAAVTDGEGRLVGELTIGDIVSVIRSEATEDLMRLSGVGDEEISDRVMTAVRSRFGWLLTGLAAALLACLVIDLFQATIQKAVALVILMPIVVAMGRNAGIQTMTVAVRALVGRDIGAHNAWRTVRREAMVGLVNGLIFAVLIGAITIYWFDDLVLGQVIAGAVTLNMIVASLAGIMIPWLLGRVGADPAPASRTVVTAVTDVAGLLSFLGMATIALPLG